MSNKPIVITFNGKTETLIPDGDGLFRLTQLHNLVDNDVLYQPNNWARTQQVVDLIGEISNSENIRNKNLPVIRSKAGRYGGTWAERRLVWAYAAWVSPEFHVAVLNAFDAAVQGKGKKAVKVAQSVARMEGVPLRKGFTSQLARHGASKGDYGSQTDAIYLTLHGKPAKDLKKERGVKKNGSLRDSMTDYEIQQISATESLATLMMMKSKDKTRGDMRKAVYDAVQYIKQY